MIRRFDTPAFWRVRGELKKARLVPAVLSLPEEAFREVAAMVYPGHRLGGALVKLATQGDKPVLWGYDPRPEQARLVPYVLPQPL